MPLRVTETTDRKYIGLIANIDPRNPPPAIPTADGALFRPIQWTQIAPGMWRIRSPQYCVIAEEI